MKLLFLFFCVLTSKVFCLNNTTIDKDVRKKENIDTIEIDIYDYENSTVSDEYNINLAKNDDYNYYENYDYENYDYENSTSYEDDYNYYRPYETVYKEYKLLYKGKKLLKNE